MYLKIMKNKKSGRTFLSIVHGYRDKEKGYTTNKVVQKLGYLDVLEKEYDDPIGHFKKVAKEMTEQAKSKDMPTTLNIHLNEELSLGIDARKNLGYAAIVKIFHELKLDKFLRNKQRSRGFKYSTYSIMLLLVISRILAPASKKSTFKDKDRYFEKFDFQLIDVYRSLTYFSELSKQIQRHLHEEITARFGRKTDLVYYDVTNYYFEINENDPDIINEKNEIEKEGLRKKGICKEHRPKPIVQMGLAMDSEGVPICYNLHPGNTNDVLTLRPMISQLKREYNLGRTVLVADKGINSGDNIWYLKSDMDCDGYVVSLSVRGSSKKFKEYVLQDKGYRCLKNTDGTMDENFKIKSRNEVRYIKISKAGGGKITKAIDEKQVIFYSKKYADKAKADRAEAVAKARDLCANPTKYNQATSYGALKYINAIEFNKETGEIITDKGSKPEFDESKLLEEEKYDGYYAIVTSEMEKSDEWIIDTYRGLWEIEENFKITKSELDARPVYVSREDHINAHFLTCFIALVILRLLEKKTNYAFPLPQLIAAMRNISCFSECENIYLFGYRSEASDAIGEALGVDFKKKRLMLSEIKNILAKCKI